MTAHAAQIPQSRCHFGIARREITPPVGIYQASSAVLEAGCLERVIDEVSQAIGQWIGEV